MDVLVRPSAMTYWYAQYLASPKARMLPSEAKAPTDQSPRPSCRTGAWRASLGSALWQGSLIFSHARRQKYSPKTLLNPFLLCLGKVYAKSVLSKSLPQHLDPSQNFSFNFLSQKYIRPNNKQSVLERNDLPSHACETSGGEGHVGVDFMNIQHTHTHMYIYICIYMYVCSTMLRKGTTRLNAT